MLWSPINTFEKNPYQSCPRSSNKGDNNQRDQKVMQLQVTGKCRPNPIRHQYDCRRHHTNCQYPLLSYQHYEYDQPGRRGHYRDYIDPQCIEVKLVADRKTKHKYKEKHKPAVPPTEPSSRSVTSPKSERSRPVTKRARPTWPTDTLALQGSRGWRW